MELKKSPKADLQNKKSIFFMIGLSLSLFIVIGMFSWSQAEVVITQIEQQGEIIEYEEVPQTVQEPPKIEPPKVAAPELTNMINIVDDKIEVKTDMSAFDSEMSEDMPVLIPTATEEEELVPEDNILLRAEKMPTFQGKDIRAFRDWIQGNVEYPQEALENNVSGAVNVSFVIGRDGTMRDVKILSSPDRSLSDAVVKELQKAPKWTPGEQRGNAVSVNVKIMISFILR